MLAAKDILGWQESNPHLSNSASTPYHCTTWTYFLLHLIRLLGSRHKRWRMALFLAVVQEYVDAIANWRRIDDKQCSDIWTTVLNEYYIIKIHVQTENTKKILKFRNFSANWSLIFHFFMFRILLWHATSPKNMLHIRNRPFWVPIRFFNRVERHWKQLPENSIFGSRQNRRQFFLLTYHSTYFSALISNLRFVFCVFWYSVRYLRKTIFRVLKNIHFEKIWMNIGKSSCR